MAVTWNILKSLVWKQTKYKAVAVAQASRNQDHAFRVGKGKE
jgi:hypothetical protein